MSPLDYKIWQSLRVILPKMDPTYLFGPAMFLGDTVRDHIISHFGTRAKETRGLLKGPLSPSSDTFLSSLEIDGQEPFADTLHFRRYVSKLKQMYDEEYEENI